MLCKHIPCIPAKPRDKNSMSYLKQLGTNLTVYFHLAGQTHVSVTVQNGRSTYWSIEKYCHIF